MNTPGDEYIAATMRNGVPGLASALEAISPATSARSRLPASSSGTFSVEPLVFLGCTRMRGSCAFTISAKASPYTGKPPPGVAVPSTRAKIRSTETNRGQSPISCRAARCRNSGSDPDLFRSLLRDAGVRHDLLVDLHLAPHEARELLGLHRRGLDAELGELLLHRGLEHDGVHGGVQLLHHGGRRRRRRP